MTDTCCADSTGTTLNRRALLGASLAVPAAGLLADGPALAGPAAGKRRAHRILVFSRTTGFRHASIETAVSAIKELGATREIAVDATEDPAAFTHDSLRAYTAIAFVNTTGNVLDETQREALRRFVKRGGGWVGVHSAADTEYTSRFYTRLLAGARFLCHPLQQPGTILRESARHRSTQHLPEQWQVPFEEFYSFTSSPRGQASILLSIDESSYAQDPNTSNLPTGPENPFPSQGVSGVMGDHPMSWQHRVGRGLSWYTALGHEIAMYYDPAFRNHLLGGLVTASRHGRRRLDR
ncbi:ThuA domain-containing protein [Nocardioides dilutus]